MPDTKEIIDYKIVWGHTLLKVEEEVQKCIKEGSYQPYGQIGIMTAVPGKGFAYQAMVKYKKEEKPTTLNADNIKKCADEFEKAYLYRV